MRLLLKFIHSLGAIGLMGAMAALLVLMRITPPPSSLAAYAQMRGAMAEIATWILFPSLLLTLAGGMLAIAFNRSFQNAGWAWAKMLTGLLMFEGGFSMVLGPIQEEAKRSASALAGQLDPAVLTCAYGAERGTLWVLMAVSLVNVILGIWRPKLSRIPD
jgi:hypothetical protein